MREEKFERKYKMPMKKHFGAEISEKLADQFLSFCEERRFQKYGAIEGALRAFMALTTDLQIKLMADNRKDVHSMLVDGLLEAEVVSFLRSLAPEQRKSLLESAKRARRKVSQKK